jgi:HAD superfamily hydrolase (TIGR01509 family)
MKENIGKENVGFLFDLDGVLIDSEKEYTKIWEAIDVEYPTNVSHFAQVIKGTTLPDILNRYFPKDKHEEISLKLHSMQSMMRFDYCDGALEFLHALRAADIKIAIVTSSDSRKMAQLWTQHPELKESVDVVIDANMITRSKPDPEGYLLAAKMLGLPNKRCVVCEDSIQGLKAGKSAGSDVIGFSGTLGRGRIAEEAKIIVDHISDINIEEIKRILLER